jgi:phosphatidylglycerophosphatase C
MGADVGLEQGGAAYRPLVAFDFDGTLTWRDSFIAFLAWRSGAMRFALGMARLVPAGLAYALRRDRGRLKAATVNTFLAGASRHELLAQADRFAAANARRLLRPDAIRCWRRWQEQGARLIIVTASPEILVAPFARGLGAEAVLGTRLAFSPSEIATGALEGRNCRGPEKVDRLTALLGHPPRLDAAYGDSDGDLEMLALAEEQGMKVFGEKP